jgi:hypothetical protein
MSANESHPTDKTALVAVIKRERSHLENVIAGLSDSQKLASGVEGSWSVKDIMSHIAAWERLAHDRLVAGSTGEPLKYPIISGDEMVDQFNAKVFHDNQVRSLEEIEAEFEAAHTALMKVISELAPEVLHQRLPFDWAGKLTYQVVISSNTHWHYVEHSESIERWLPTPED